MARRNNFDALRLVAALAVIFSHSFLIAQGNDASEPLNILTGRQCMLGHVGVFVFFTISGFLVTQSYEQTPAPLHFLAKRALRIFPGLGAALVISAFVLGPLVSDLHTTDYLHSAIPYRYVFSNLLLSTDVHELPGVLFVNNPVGLEVNGSLWTLRYEVMMYFMVFVLGILRLLSLPICLGLLGLGMAVIYFPALDDLGGWGWLLGFFATGMVLYRLKDKGIFNHWLAFLAGLGLVASVPLHQFILLFPLFGSYLALYLALHPQLPVLPAARFGDLSYGLYIYGWPAGAAVIYALQGNATWWEQFLLSTATATCLAFLSWHLIEKPALRLKPRATAAFPGMPSRSDFPESSGATGV